MRGMGRGLSDHLVVLRKVKLVGAWIERREVLVRARRIRREKLRVHQYSEGGWYWQLVIKRQEKDVFKPTEKKRERLKGVYIRAKRK